MTENFPLVSVVLLNYNGRRFLETLFSSILKTEYPKVEWIFVDNASSDDSVFFVKNNFPAVKVIVAPENLGYTGGNNLGIKSASGSYIVLLNNDVEVRPDWLTSLVAMAESNPKIGALQPKLQSMINRGYFEYAGASGGFIDPYGFPFLRGRIFDTIELDQGQYDDVREIFWASGAAIFLRKSALDEIGLLDETFFMHFEEIDLCWRLHLAGFQVFVVPSSVVYHYVSASLPAANFKKLYWNHRNNLILLFKNLSGSKLVPILLVRMILDGVAALHGLVRGEPKRIGAVLKAHFWIYFNLARLFRLRRDVQSKRICNDSEFSHLVYSRSIVVDYFLKKKKDFNTLAFNATSETK